MTTPDVRQTEERKPAKEPPKPKKSKKNEDDGFGAFSIDSALGGGESSSTRPEFGSGSSVVASDDAKRVEKEIENSEPFVPPTSPLEEVSCFQFRLLNTNGRTILITTYQSSEISEPAEKPKPRRRRAVRKAKSEPEPEPEEEPQQDQKTFWQEEEEEFSDFSF